MSSLYPRLLPSRADDLFRALNARGPRPPRDREFPSLEYAVFAATGGQRTTPARLQGLRAELISQAVACGFPAPATVTQRTRFDSAVARYLHTHLDLVPGEASQRQIWSYLALVLLPDVCAWRFPPRPDGTYVDDRFKGTDLTRHALGRLWTRAHLLHAPSPDDPYALLDVLGENDLDQILARRRDIAATPDLVRAIVRTHRDDPANGDGTFDRDVLRDTLKRLMRLCAFLDLDSRDNAELDHLVAGLRERSRDALRSPSYR
jgi:hypothetical protein